MKIGICWHCKRLSIDLRPIIMTASKIDDTHEVKVCKFCEGLLVRAQDHEPNQEPEPDPLDEIEVLFDNIKESDLLQSNVVEHNELVSSRLIVAYYLCKLERKIK